MYIFFFIITCFLAFSVLFSGKERQNSPRNLYLTIIRKWVHKSVYAKNYSFLYQKRGKLHFVVFISLSMLGMCLLTSQYHAVLRICKNKIKLLNRYAFKYFIFWYLSCLYQQIITQNIHFFQFQILWLFLEAGKCARILVLIIEKIFYYYAF